MTTIVAHRRIQGPSTWVDRLALRIARSGVPEPVVYSSGALGLYALMTLSQWSAGSYPVGSLSGIEAVMVGAIAFLPWMIGAINRSAVVALDRVRPLLGMGDEAFAELKHRVVDTPGWLDLGVAAIWVVALLVRLLVDPTVARTIDVDGEGPGALFGILILVLFVLVASAYVVKVAHLALWLRRLSSAEMTVSLWELGPLHGLSILTARMALGIVASVLALFLARRDSLSDPAAIAAVLSGSAIAAAVFVLPLLRIHDRLVAEKGHLRAAGARTMEEAVIGLHRAIEAGDLASMDAHYKAVAAVEIELRTISAIPTWPWLPDTFRWVAGALMFPIVLFVVQWLIGRMLGT